MTPDFDACFAAMELEEGWHQFSLDPHDPGGATWCGLTQRSYDAWRRSRALPARGVRQATDAELATIYRGEYWNAVRGDDLFAGLDLAVFDYAVNAGARQATLDLQRSLNAALPSLRIDVDGVFGLETLHALQRLVSRDGEEDLIHAICARRFAFWRALKTFRWFGAGWKARGERIERKSLALFAASLEPTGKGDKTA